MNKKITPWQAALRIILFILVIVCAATIFYLSSQVAEDSNETSYSLLAFLGFSEELNSIIRETAHGIEYLGFSALICTFLRSMDIKALKSVILSVMISIAYAVTDEIHQILVPGRAFEIFDICIDSAGAVTGALLMTAFIALIICISRKRKSKEKKA